jgi:phytoene dehydrogenase-like protein
VRRILVDEGKVHGVEMASGEVHEAPVVVSNADLKRTFLDLVGEEHISAATAERVKSFRMALPLFCVYLGLDIDLRERGIPNTNLFLFDSYDLEGIHEDCYEGRLPPNLSVFMTIASIKDPHSRNIAPEGHTNLQLMTLVPPHYALWGIEEGPARGEKYRRTAQYRAVKEQLMEALIARANEVVPGLADHIVWKEAASPITQERYTLSTGGTSYGIEMAPDQFGPSRPAARTEIDGLYLAGASTQSGHGVAGVMISGVVTAGAVLDTNLMKRIREGEVFGRPELLPETGPDWDPWRACF